MFALRLANVVQEHSKIEDITSKIDDFLTLYRPPVSENIQNETGTSLNDSALI